MTCCQKAIQASTDSLLSLAYISNCEYVTDLSDLATQTSRSCDMLGNGFVYQFGAQGALGVLYIFVIFVGIKGFHVWQFWEEDIDEYQEEQRQKAIMNATGGAGSSGASGIVERRQVQQLMESMAAEEYEGEEGGELLASQAKYYTEWTHGVSKIGPPVETLFHNMLTDHLMTEEKEYKAGLPPEEMRDSME